jgi:D-Tyr-tRNAtyr deacylase
MIEIKGKYNTNILRKFQFHVTGKFSIVGGKYHVLLISQFTYDGTTYKGILP